MALRVTAEADTELITAVKNHGFRVGQKVAFRRMSGGTGITAQGAAGASGSLSPATVYHVIAAGLTNDDFEVSATAGGSAVNITADMTAGQVRRVNGMGR